MDELVKIDSIFFIDFIIPSTLQSFYTIALSSSTRANYPPNLFTRKRKPHFKPSPKYLFRLFKRSLLSHGIVLSPSYPILHDELKEQPPEERERERMRIKNKGRGAKKGWKAREAGNRRSSTSTGGGRWRGEKARKARVETR